MFPDQLKESDVKPSRPVRTEYLVLFQSGLMRLGKASWVAFKDRDGPFKNVYHRHCLVQQGLVLGASPGVEGDLRGPMKEKKCR